MTYSALSKTMKIKTLVIAAAALCCSSAAYAHHSFAKFEMGKLTTVTGTVKEWTWANPHTWLIVTVNKPKGGGTEDWALVGSSPNMMSRWGWRAADIKVGDKVTVDVHRGIDGSPIGAMKNVFLANGKVLSDPAGATGQALAAGAGKAPAKPQGQPYK